MGEVIYLDLVFLNDFLTSWVILWMTAFLWRKQLSFVRLLISSCIGSIGAIGLMFPQWSLLYSPPGKIVFLMFLLVITFFPRSPSDWLYGSAYLLLANGLYAGLTFFLALFTERLPDVFSRQIKTGLVSFVSPSLWTFVLAFLFMIVLSRLVYPVLVWRWREKAFHVQLTLMWEDKTTKVTGYVDTGNALIAGVKAEGVALVRLTAIEDILPKDLIRLAHHFYAHGDQHLDIFSTDIGLEKWGHRVRLIPYRAVGKQGLLLTVRLDAVMIRARTDATERRLFKRTVALVEDDFGLGEHVDALVPPDWVAEDHTAFNTKRHHVAP